MTIFFKRCLTLFLALLLLLPAVPGVSAGYARASASAERPAANISLGKPIVAASHKVEETTGALRSVLTDGATGSNVTSGSKRIQFGWDQNEKYIILDLGEDYNIAYAELYRPFASVVHHVKDVSLYGSMELTGDYTSISAIVSAFDTTTERLTVASTNQEASFRYIKIRSTGQELLLTEVSIFGSRDTEPLPVEELEYYVSPEGSDSNPGTLDHPFLTIQRARDELRGKTAAMEADAHVYLRGGIYPVEEPIVFTEADSGGNGFTVHYQSYGSETPVIDGGKRFTGGWETYNGNILRRLLPGISNMRELYIDGSPQVMARSAPMSGTALENDRTAFVMKTSDLPPEGFAKPAEIMYLQNHNWRNYMLPVESVEIGEETSIVHFKHPNIDWYLTKLNFEADMSAWFILENALELLDEPGEWYFDRTAGYLYLMPGSGMDPNTAELTVPQAAEMLRISGSSPGSLAHHLVFEGLTFRYSSWLEVNERGFAHSQTTALTTEQGTNLSVVPAAVTVTNSTYIQFSGNVFENMEATALNVTEGVSDIGIAGNVFRQIGGGAVNIGLPTHGKVPLGDSRLPARITVSNNILRDIGMIYSGCAAVTSYYSDGLTISHNDIDGTGYSGISVGWGWSLTADNLRNTAVSRNKIQNFSRKTVDGSAIYSLSRHIDSGYTGNYVKNIYTPFNTAALYHDQGSSGFTDRNNVLEIERADFIAYNLNNNGIIDVQDLYTTTGNLVTYGDTSGLTVKNVHLYPDGDWPEAALNIIAEAGLEPEYQHLFNKLPGAGPREPRPHVRSSGTNYVQSLIWEPLNTYSSEETYAAPFVEEAGTVVMDARDYHGYTGLEESQYSFIGVLGWFDNFASKYTLLLRKNFIQDPIREAMNGVPRLAYTIRFTTPGDYEVLLRGKSPAHNGVRVRFDGVESGFLPLPSEFAFSSLSDDGAPVRIHVPAAGEYELLLEAEAGHYAEMYLDKIVLTLHPSAELSHGSTAFGPQTSGKSGVPHVWVPLKHAFLPAVAAETVNHSLGSTITVSSNPGSAALLADNSTLTGWQASLGDQQPSIVVDLGEPQPVYQVSVSFGTQADEPEQRCSFEIQAANEPGFNEFASWGIQGSQPVAFREVYTVKGDLNQKYRYIRLVKTTPGLNVSELRVQVPKVQESISHGWNAKAVSTSLSPAELELLFNGYAPEKNNAVSPVEAGDYLVLDLGQERRMDEFALSGLRLEGLDGTRLYGGDDAAEMSEADTLLLTVDGNLAENGGQSFRHCFPTGSTHRFIKLYFQASANVVLNEISLLEHPILNPDLGVVEAAQGKPIVEVQSSEALNLDLVRYKLTDGIYKNDLHLKGSPSYVVLDLLEPVRIGKVRLTRWYANVPAHVKDTLIIGYNNPDGSDAVVLQSIPASYNDMTTDQWTGLVSDEGAYRYIKILHRTGADMPLKEVELFSAAE
ncbi:MAG: hypothetical protein K0R57_3392 [Paenibacillaceae bacterium]|jgi:hypothetical protein|nr:hypothetical protein [Paenibacillaceae bacterium]